MWADFLFLFFALIWFPTTLTSGFMHTALSPVKVIKGVCKELHQTEWKRITFMGCTMEIYIVIHGLGSTTCLFPVSFEGQNTPFPWEWHHSMYDYGVRVLRVSYCTQIKWNFTQLQNMGLLKEQKNITPLKSHSHGLMVNPHVIMNTSPCKLKQ